MFTFFGISFGSLPPLELRQGGGEFDFSRLQPGVDNVRSDVWLSPELRGLLHAHQAALLAKITATEDLRARRKSTSAPERRVLKATIHEYLESSLQQAHGAQNYELALLAHVALYQDIWTEFQRLWNELAAALRDQVQRLEAAKTPDRAHVLAARTRLDTLQANRSGLLKRAGDDFYGLFHEIEMEGLQRARRAVLGPDAALLFRIFDSRLAFAEPDDNTVLAENYVLFGRYERDPDRLENYCRAALDFLAKQGALAPATAGESAVAEAGRYLAVPETTEMLFGSVLPGAAPPNPEQRLRARRWLRRLEKGDLIWRAAAAYEVPGLTRLFVPPLNHQQVKNAMLHRREMARVLQVLATTHISPAPLQQARQRLHQMGRESRLRLALRLYSDLARYLNDVTARRTLLHLARKVHLIGEPGVRELSALNHTLYEFLLPREQTQATQRITGHVILKADVRESTLLTTRMVERGLNPASHFSRNLFEPLNQFLALYGAEKVFLEGDAVIVALYEHDHQPSPIVSRACALARQLLELVELQNRRSEAQGLPLLELGIGIAYSAAAPLFLADGERRIMISPALNLSDRLASCARRAKRALADQVSGFRVFLFESGKDEEDFLPYNVDGIRLSPSAGTRLQGELAWQPIEITATLPWQTTPAPVVLQYAQVPITAGKFTPLLLRSAHALRLNAVGKAEGEGTVIYYELCANPALYAAAEAQLSRHAEVSG
ncbi:MAG: hypothetical protein ACYC6M_14650 [Terriglobales bacterium]